LVVRTKTYPMKQFWLRVSHFGVASAESREDRKSVQLTNTLALALMPALALMTIAVTIIQKGNNPLLYLQPINMASAVAVLWLNYKNKINLARWVFCIVPPTNIVLFSVLTKIHGLTNNFAFALMPRAGLTICLLVPVLFFGYARRKTLAFAILPSLISIIGFDYFHSLFGIDLANFPYYPKDYMLIRASYVVTLFAIIPAILTLQQTNMQYEQEVFQQKEEILAQRDDLNQKTIALHQTNEDLMASINYAKRIQTAMLPSAESIKAILPKSFVFFRPRDVVSGDFYYCHDLPNKVILAAVDCTGHGVPGAFMSMIGNEILNETILAKNIDTPNLILEELHKGVQKALKQKETQNQDGMDLALVALTKHPTQAQTFTSLAYAGAMNPLYLFTSKDGSAFEFTEVKATKLPIGGFLGEEQRTFANYTHDLQSENHQVVRFYLCSDGFQDQFGGEKGQKFMTKKFKELLLNLQTQALPTHEQALQNVLTKWTNQPKVHEQIDDILILGVEI
jgi:serine phosphatase RsbU (regulator of sigma subunit)